MAAEDLLHQGCHARPAPVLGLHGGAGSEDVLLGEGPRRPVSPCPGAASRAVGLSWSRVIKLGFFFYMLNSVIPY